MTQTADALRALLRDVAERLQITRPLAAFDLETTGTNPERDRIVEITIGRVEPTTLNTQLLHTLVNPGIPIPADASAIHGITDEAVRDAPPFAKIVRFVVPLLSGASLVGYNHRRFDVRMIATELRHAGVTEDPCEAAHLIDAQAIYFKREPRDLAAALQFFCGDSHEGAHGTTADVMATLRVLLKQLERYDDLPRDVEALHEFCRDASWVDRDGKIIWRDGKACLGFGPHQGVPLAIADRGFLSWMLGKNFPPDTKEIVRQALNGNYPLPTTSAAPRATSASEVVA